MTESFRTLDIGFSPEAAVSGAILVQSEFSTTLIFNATTKVGEYYRPVGHGIVTFRNCSITRFGYPNDEARRAIPRTQDLTYDAYEVLESEWDAELGRLNRLAFPNYQRPKRRHFVWLFHDNSFECLAADFSARVSEEPLAAILAEICKPWSNNDATAKAALFTRRRSSGTARGRSRRSPPGTGPAGSGAASSRCSSPSPARDTAAGSRGSA